MPGLASAADLPCSAASCSDRLAEAQVAAGLVDIVAGMAHMICTVAASTEVVGQECHAARKVDVHGTARNSAADEGTWLQRHQGAQVTIHVTLSRVGGWPQFPDAWKCAGS